MEDGLGASHRLHKLHRLRWERPLQRLDIRKQKYKPKEEKGSFPYPQRFLQGRNELRWYHEVYDLRPYV